LLQIAVKPTTLRADAAADPASTVRAIDALAVAVLLTLAAIAAATFRGYGLGWDDYLQFRYGHDLLSLYASGFKDTRALSFVNLYMYGGGFDLLSTVVAKILPFDEFATRRLVGAAIGLAGLLATWRLGRRLGGPLAGLIALALLAACPLYYGHMFINAKDGPFATAMVIALLGIVRAFEEYPRATPATIALCGIGVGLAVGSRVLGGFAVIEAFLPLALILPVRSRARGVRSALGECGRFLVPFIPSAILAYLVMGLTWPWSVLAPLNPFRAAAYFSHFSEKPWRDLFAGRLIEVTQMPRDYVPILTAVKLPELMLALGLCGIAGALVVSASNARGSSAGRRAALLATALAALLPVLVTVVVRPAMYNGIRHFVFIVPPLAVLGGLAAGWIARRLERYGRAAMAAGAIILLAGLASPAVEMVRLHPYEYTYFNQFVGGVPGARKLFMIDYWGLSLTQAARELRARTAGRETVRLAVCGPHPPVRIAMGAGSATTWSPRSADFALVLGEHFCAKLNAPVLLEIVREGVVYARVYDLRGRSISTSLLVPRS
jgi:4-amino-4-deoxy-L-arabinose transferase-like glycosyltransferase